MTERLCKVTGKTFTIGRREADAYERFGLVLPEISPEERLRRRLSFQNDHRFSWRKCGRSGARIYSVFGANTPFPVFSDWYASPIDPTEYSQEYLPNRPFFEQLLELWQRVPRPASAGLGVEGSQVVEECFGAHRCYRSALVVDGERVLYSVNARGVSASADCLFVSDSRYLYDCTDCHGATRLRFAENCIDCHDGFFLRGCVSCKNCAFCTNLTGKEFCLFNRQLTPADFVRAIGEWDLTLRPKLEAARERFAEITRQSALPHLVADDASAESTGNHLIDTTTSYHSFECEGGRQLLYCDRLRSAENCVDVSGFGEGIRDSIGAVSCGLNAARLMNCVQCWGDVEDLAYCGYCSNSRHLFGCVGVRGGEYLIFNRQRSKAEYDREMAEIEDLLKRKRVWGKFFPAVFADFPYNGSAAADYMPLGKVQAGVLQVNWDDTLDEYKPTRLLSGGEERFADLPERLDDVTEDLTKAVFLCEMSGRPYQITPDELALYRELRVAPPSRGFEQRHRERLSRLGPRRLTKRKFGEREVETAFGAETRSAVVLRSEIGSG